MAGFMCYLIDSVWGWVQWKSHQYLCQCLYDLQEGDKIPIPPYFEDDNPLEIFQETHVEVNLYRWVVFVLWLKTHPQAWRWFQIIQKTQLIPSLLTLENTLWHLERNEKKFQ